MCLAGHASFLHMNYAFTSKKPVKGKNFSFLPAGGWGNKQLFYFLGVRPWKPDLLLFISNNNSVQEPASSRHGTLSRGHFRHRHVRPALHRCAFACITAILPTPCSRATRPPLRLTVESRQASGLAWMRWAQSCGGTGRVSSRSQDAKARMTASCFCAAPARHRHGAPAADGRCLTGWCPST